MCKENFKNFAMSSVRATFNFGYTSGFTGTQLVVVRHYNHDPCAQIKGEPSDYALVRFWELSPHSLVSGLVTGSRLKVGSSCGLKDSQAQSFYGSLVYELA